MIKVGINGLGRIGRALYRAIATDESRTFEVCAINASCSPKDAAFYLKHDSLRGSLNKDIAFGDDFIECCGVKTFFTHERDPNNINWGKYGVDIVLECTGAFKTRESNEPHISKGGAKAVVISCPSPDSDFLSVYGVNTEDLGVGGKHTIISAASCTTNALAPIVKVMVDNFDVLKAQVITVHSVTNDQRIIDANHKDPRRSRACFASIIPTSSGAAKNISLIFPHLMNKINVSCVRVPTTNASLVDCSFVLKQKTDIQELSKIFSAAAAGKLKGVLGVCDEPLVSIDYNMNPNSVVIDLPCLQVTDGDMCRIVGWYDNEWAFALRMLDLAKQISGSVR